MKVVILAGGKGTRIADVSTSLPKPMLDIAGKPMIIRIMEHYAKFGYKEFIIALGFKSKLIKEYFINYSLLNSNLIIDYKKNDISIINNKKLDYTVSLIDTGLETLTGTRLKKLKKYLDKDKFFLTYGDGISNVNLNSLLNFHNKKKKIATLTTVRPAARFGELACYQGLITRFEEKPKLKRGYINGGFFVIEPEFFSFIPKKMCMLEREPINNLVKNKKIAAYFHNGFWHCVDTKRDLDFINKLYNSNEIKKIFK